MSDGVAKMEQDVLEGRCYDLGLLVKEQDDKDGEVQQQPARKKARVNKLTSSADKQECKCGSWDHIRVLSRNCAWKGLLKKEIFENYERRLKDAKAEKEAGTATGYTVPTTEIVQRTTSKYLAPMRTRKDATSNHQKECDIKFRNTKVCNTITHVTHLVHLLRTGYTARNPSTPQLLPSVNDIAAIAELEAHEDAIIIAQDEITYLDDLSLEGDVPDDVLDIVEVREKALFTRN
jgi:hypothetical protein